MKMRGIAAIGLFAAVALWWSATAWAAQPVAEGPELYAPETIYDFGTVVEGRSVSHQFVIANKGNGPLQILGMKSG